MTEQNSLKCFSEHKALILILVVNCYRLLLLSSQPRTPYFLSCLWGDSHEEAFGLGIFLFWSCSSCFSIRLELHMKWKISQSRWHAEGEKKKKVNHKAMEGNRVPFIYFSWSLWQCMWTRWWAFGTSIPSLLPWSGSAKELHCSFIYFKDIRWYVGKNISNSSNTHHDTDNAVVLCVRLSSSFPSVFLKGKHTICASVSLLLLKKNSLTKYVYIPHNTLFSLAWRDLYKTHNVIDEKNVFIQK